jgi:DNA replication protein DnaC
MQHELMIQRLKALKLYPMTQPLTDLVQRDSPAYQSCSPILSQTLRAELTEREVRSVAYQMKVAKFPAYRGLQGFDFGCSEVNEALVRQLHRGEFIEPAHNVALVGGPRTGKTHLATAFAVHASEHLRRRVRFFSTIELVNTLELEKQAGKAGHLAHRFTYSHVVILDELG